jgi:hypothetical protein
MDYRADVFLKGNKVRTFERMSMQELEDDVREYAATWGESIELSVSISYIQATPVHSYVYKLEYR